MRKGVSPIRGHSPFELPLAVPVELIFIQMTSRSKMELKQEIQTPKDEARTDENETLAAW
jgi:hypothetical protein